MDNTVEILDTVCIGTVVAIFLLNSNRVLQAIKLCQECLILVNNTSQEEVVQLANRCLYKLKMKGYFLLNDQTSAIECAKKRLEFVRRLGLRGEECEVTSHQANIYRLQGKYEKAEVLYKKSLSIAIETGDRKKEALCCGNLGTIYQSLYQYGKAEEYYKKALAIAKEIGDKIVEGKCYAHIGHVWISVGEIGKAVEYIERGFLIIKESVKNVRHKGLECYAGMGALYQSIGEYGKAEEYLRKAHTIEKEISTKQGEATCYGNLENAYQSLGEYGKAEEYQWKALAFTKETGDNFKQEEAAYYAKLGAVCQNLGEYGKAEEYQRTALAIRKGIGDKHGEAKCYGYLGIVYKSLGEYKKAEEYQRKALAITKEIGNKHGEAECHLNLGFCCRILGNHSKAKDHHEKALAISREIGDIKSEATCHLNLATDIVSAGDTSSLHEIVSNLRASIEKYEEMRSCLESNDQFKISLLDLHSSSFHFLSSMLSVSGNAKEALSVLELGRGRALADLISALYSGQQQTSVNPPSWADIESIVKKECNCSCLYISHFLQYMFLLVLKGNKQLHVRKINVNKCFVTEGLERTVYEVFGEKSFREFNVLPEEQCEDRSLAFSKANDSTCEPAEEESLAGYRLIEEEEQENLQPLPTRAERYRMIIAPVADFLDQPELIIVPDPALYKVPFAALENGSGNYLSEVYRIRIVPSLTTLGLIQDSPEDYHSQTGALIVGEPDVRDVSYKGSLGVLCRLPAAKEEAEMIGELIGAVPLLGRQATKQAVLQRIPSVSLIHFAAHGDAERGEIALAPQYPINGIPTEKDYLLTMADISQVKLRAKLVVLSCCHSAQGQVKAEGVIGIARAFIGSGARSVLVALWAIPDEATKKLMGRFYEHLVRGESASESLHQAMKWMRNNGYPDVRDWAPFMLIGDNVTFDFGK